MKIFYSLLIISILSGAAACNKKIEALQKNPNQPTTLTPELVMGTVLKDISGTGSNGNLGGINSWSDVHKYNQYFVGAYGYYGDNQYNWSSGSFSPYLTLKNVIKMEEEAAKRNLPATNPYKALGKFLRAYYFYNLTSLMGDIPMSDALKELDNLTPAYTAQKDVFKYVLNVLDSANADFTTLLQANNTTISNSVQDIYFGGALDKWQRVVNTFKLRVLLSLSNAAGAADMNIGAQFAAIFNNPVKYPVVTSQNEDLKFTYVAGFNQFPLNKDNFGSTASRYGMAQTYVSGLTTLRDPRVYVTCEPAWGLIEKNHYDTTDFRAFVGASTGTSIDRIEADASARLFSFINRNRFYNTFTGEPDVLVGYKELCFNIAEAINRGWISGDAESWYKKGITESMAFYGIDIAKTTFTAWFLPTGDLTKIKAYPFTFNFSDYYNQPAVTYAGGTNGLHQILLQKYIAMFQNSGWEAYFNYRRTGVPALSTGTGIGNNGNIPLRWGYPVNEQNQNTANWKAALTNQGFATDDINARMWLIK